MLIRKAEYMIRKLKFVIVTIILRIRFPHGLLMKGVQKFDANTFISIRNGGCISFGKKTRVSDRTVIAVNGGRINIGDYVYFNSNCNLVSHESINIGDNCLFGPNVIVYDHDHRFNSKGVVKNQYRTAPIIIENNCWLGSNVIVLRGTHIGEGSVIGAGAVVKGDIPPHSLVKAQRSLVIEPIN